MVVQHNLTAMNSNRMLGITTGQQAKSSEKLASGYQINRAADDAAGLSISEKMRKQMRGLDRASTNAEDGISAVQTAEGALAEVHSMLQRMNELAVQAANGTNSSDDREAIQAEVEELTTEINRVAESTKFNESYLLKGSNSTKTVHINAKDAGLKGTLVQGATDKSTFTMELNVGETVAIGGADYRLYKTGENDIESVQAKIWNAETGKVKDGAKDGVIIDGSSYTYSTDIDGNGKEGFVDSNGNAYTGDQLAALVGDGSTVTIGEETTHVVDKDADDAKTVNEAIALVENALKDASSIGGTKPAEATAEGDNAAKLADVADALAQLDAVVDALNTATPGTVVGGAAVKVNVGGEEFSGVVATGGKAIDWAANADDLATAIGKLEAGEEIQLLSDAGANLGNAVTTIEAEKASGTYTFGIQKAEVDVKKDLTFSLHVGADTDMNNKIMVNIASMDAAGLGIQGLNVADNTGIAATYAIDSIADAVAKVSAQRSALGAIQNRLEHTIANLDNVVENTTAAESRIRDTDMAEEMVEYSKNNILAQAGQSMLAQANQSTQGVLSILG